MKRTLILFSLIMCLTYSCERIKNKTQETINKGGEVVGETATEFFEGVSEGIDRTLECEILLSEALKEKGLATGKYSIESNNQGGENNQLTLYIIFNKDFKDSLFVKAFDKNGLEIGRTNMTIERKAGEAGYYDFVFDERTYIEVKSKILIE